MATMKILLVGGGGGGSNVFAGGGGGGGGVYYNSAYAITNNTFYCVVGVGGDINGAGGNSTFGPFYVAGGGAGGTSVTSYLSNAGGGNYANFTPTSSSGYGGGASTAGHAGGGGGAGGTGGPASQVTGGGHGGAGVYCDISGTNLIYGEGGGGGYGGTTSGVGGQGATGAGVVGSGMTNRGGGGGGSYNSYGTGTGGTGVVIISYLTDDWGTCTGGTKTTSGSYTVHTFTSTGTFTVVQKIKKIAGVLPINGISLDSTSFYSNGAGAATTTLTWAHTIGNGTDRCLIIYIPVSQAVYPSTIKFNGVDLTSVVAMANGDSKAYIFVLVNPPVGTYNCEVVFNGSLQYLLAAAASFFGVDQTNPTTNVSSVAGSGTNKSNTIYNPYANTWILECYGAGAGVNSATAGQTTITGDNRISSYDTGVIEGINTQTWSCATSATWAWVACCLKPSMSHWRTVDKVLGTSAKKIMGLRTNQ